MQRGRQAVCRDRAAQCAQDGVDLLGQHGACSVRALRWKRNARAQRSQASPGGAKVARLANSNAPGPTGCNGVAEV
jgi:hypothetical protein